jgi:hypothetical protein
MNWKELETKYVEERVAILRHLRKIYGPTVIEEARKAKAEVICQRVKRCLPEPADMERIYQFVFKEFEGVSEVIEYEIVERSPTFMKVKVTKCWWADLYQRLGAEDIGYELVCGMDFDWAPYLNPNLKFTRTKTLMQGDDYCDHTYELPSSPPTKR